jgi:enamine deaminase RidA (YjgF/YER057c/UK114 family)
MSHELINPPDLAPPFGFSHVVVPAPGRLVFLGGQAGHLPDGTMVSADLVEQFEQAAVNVVAALAAAGAQPDHLVSLHIYTTDIDGYRAQLSAIGAAYRRRLGRHYPAIALFGVTALFDPAANLELVGIAVVPA